MSIFHKRQKLLQGILSISMSVGNSCLSLVAALKNLSNAGGVSCKLKILFMIFNPPNLPSNIFVAKNLPVCLLVRDCQCSYLSRKSKSVLPVFEFFLIINWFTSARSESLVTFKCLYNAVILSSFTFCLNRKVDVASVVSGSVNDVSSTLLVFGIM